MKNKSAYLVVVCCFLVHGTALGSDIYLYHTVGLDAAVVFLVSQAVAYLLYPLLGWLADVYFTRYKFIAFSFVLMIVTSLLLIGTASLFINFTAARLLYLLAGVSLIIGLVGMGAFESTAIQFGMDQMLEASSEQLSTFIHWYYWSCNVGRLILLYIMAGVLAYFGGCVLDLSVSNPIEMYIDVHPLCFTISCTTMIIMFSLQLACACVGLCLLVYYKKHFNIDRTGEHPLKLIYQVLKYAWKHKCPENRSAFTYWEEDIPPRIDLGKNKYGGPFTTEEVEDTKTFFSILLLLLSLIGFHLSGHGYSILNQLMKKHCPHHWFIALFSGNPMQVVLLTIIVGVLVHRLLVYFIPKYFPNMLKRMGLGLLCCFLKVVTEITIQSTMVRGDDCTHFANNTLDSCYFLMSKFNINGTCDTITNFTDGMYYCSPNNMPFLLLIIPNLLQGFSYLLVFMTALEFICAQAPLRLKGLLIGVWYAMLAANYVLLQTSELYIHAGDAWLTFQAAKAFLILVSFAIYLCMSKHYHYRLRDEVVNEQFLVEEIYERELDQAAEYEKEKLITSEDITSTYGSVTDNKDAM